MPPVVFDDREHKLTHLAETLNLFPFKKKRLPIGDVIIGEPGKEIYLERKTITDFWASMTDARLHNQLGNKLELISAAAHDDEVEEVEEVEHAFIDAGEEDNPNDDNNEDAEDVSTCSSATASTSNASGSPSPLSTLQNEKSSGPGNSNGSAPAPRPTSGTGGRKAAVILEGSIALERDPRLRARKRLLYGKLINLTLRDRVPVFMTQDLRETYQLILVMAENYYAALCGHDPRDYMNERMHGRRKGRARDDRLSGIAFLESMVSMLPGVTEKTAARVVRMVMLPQESTSTPSNSSSSTPSPTLLKEEEQMGQTNDNEVEKSLKNRHNDEKMKQLHTNDDEQQPPPRQQHATMRDFAERLHGDPLALEKLYELGLKLAASKLLLQTVCGPAAKSLRRQHLIETLAAVPGASEGKVRLIMLGPVGKYSLVAKSKWRWTWK
eukprot:g1610.t1